MKKFVLGLVAAAASVAALAGEGASFTAHEWGTFTSVQGADGIQMEWNPFVAAELPQFVYDRNRPNHEANRQNFALFAGKTAFAARQRMETPVIYFYSAEKQNVDVRVDFPSGVMTEWYPHATSCDAQRTPGQTNKNSFLEWKGVEVAPSSEATPRYPVEPGKSHYYAARAEGASALRIKNAASGAMETEGFLFYRGVGHFEAPLNVTLHSDGAQIALRNKGKQELHHLIVLKVDQGGDAKGEKGYSMATFDKMGSGGSEGVVLKKLSAGTREELKASLQKALVAEGLFKAEAMAMVKTWEDSWLDEPGLRVLYVLGREWTDQTLPLKISPAPKEVARVMIGRAEVITPRVEVALYNSIIEYQKGNEASREKAVANVRALNLGRFQQAALRRLTARTPAAEFAKVASELLSKVNQPPKNQPLALR
jgi:hypothetical protein